MATRKEPRQLAPVAWENPSPNPLYPGMPAKVETTIPILESPGFLTDIRQIINKYAEESERDILLEYCRKRFEENEHWVFFARSYLIHLLMSKPSQCDGHEAADNLKLLSLLIRAGYDMNVRDAMGNAPLHQAVKLKDIKGVQFLIVSGCDVNLVDSEGKTALARAVKTIPCSVDIVKSLVTMSKDIDINFVDSSGWNALCYAAYCDNVEVCDLLLGLGANPNSSLPSLITPLSVAIKYDRSIAVMRLLIEGGNFINRSEGITSDHLFEMATLASRIDVVQLLLQAGVWHDRVWFQNIPFLTALKRDNLAIVKLFIEEGGVEIMSLNPDFKLSTILHEAARFRSAKVLKYIIETTDMDINFQNSAGMTALILAVMTKRVHCLKELLSAGANGYIPEKNGATPLHCAVLFSGGSSTVLKVLLQNLYYKMSDIKRVEKLIYAHELKQILNDWLKKHAKEASPLQQLCIQKIRSHLEQRPAMKLQPLHLPYRLIEMITEIVHTPCPGEVLPGEYTKCYWKDMDRNLFIMGKYIKYRNLDI